MFIAQSCSRHDFSSELFGHKKGVFASAVSDKKGLIEIANEGTLFLDEIEDMSMVDQARILQILEIGTYNSVRSTEQKKANVKILVASNKNLQKQVENGMFLDNLLSKINKLHIIFSPLQACR